MTEPFLGEIRMFSGNFAPQGWAFCDGQILAVSSNDALFSLLGTRYGGDGRTTFGLPDLRGRIPVHPGQGPGLRPVVQGQKLGAEAVTLTPSQLPFHTHALQASENPSTNAADPVGDVTGATGAVPLYGTGSEAALDPDAIGSTGGSQRHDNMAPSLTIHFIIALFGVYPSRS